MNSYRAYIKTMVHRRPSAGMTTRLLAMLLAVCCMAMTASAATEHSIPVLAGAESHGMIDACDCEVAPGGGVAKRASLVASLRKEKGEILLLDAGGFSAGGIYDDYTEGHSADSLRTVAMMRAMGMMRYDAVAVGDDDLQLGGAWLRDRALEDSLPLVSANTYTNKGKMLVKPYRIVKKNGLRIAVTAVTTPERLFPVDESITVRDPVASLRRIWKKMSKKSDLQIILSHLGEEGSAALARAFPDADLVVNGHRKQDKQPLMREGDVPILQFGFQGKSLSGIHLSVKGDSVRTTGARWYDVVPEIPEDPAYTELLQRKNGTATTEKKIVYDLYIMSQCPYGLEALGEFLAFRDAAEKTLEWHLWFIGDVSGDTVFSSLHGEQEVVDEMRWLAVRELYPKLWGRFLRQRVATDESTLQLLDGLGIDLSRIEKWVENNGKSLLRQHYTRSTRLSLNASPTLLVNNRPFGRAVVDGNLRRFYCSSVEKPPAMCASLPECVEDVDCRAPGKLGRCVEGSCEQRDAVRFVFTVVVADSTFSHPEEKVVATTRELFPGVEVKTFLAASEKGKRLIATYRVKALPFYLFGKEAAQAHNFSTIENGLVNHGDGFSFQSGIVPVNYHLEPTRKRGTTVLYIDPFFKGLPAILSHLTPASGCTILPTIFQDPAKVERGTDEWFRQEEAARWLALGAIGDSSVRKYLHAYAERPGSSYWNKPLAASGVGIDSLMRQLHQSDDALALLWAELSSLSIREPVVVLLDNVETVVVGGERELRRVLGRSGK